VTSRSQGPRDEPTSRDTPAPRERSKMLAPEFAPPREPVSKYDLPRKEHLEEPRHPHPRSRGVLLFGGGVLLLIMSITAHVQVGKATCVVPVLLLYGGWTMVVGEPIGKDGKPAAWGQVGAWLAGVLGIAVSILVAALMSR
jgi:hypothetical protein